MFGVSEEILAKIRRTYPRGTRVELVKMDDFYSNLLPGDKGTVICVDSIGTIHVSWDRGSSLGIIYGEDEVRII